MTNVVETHIRERETDFLSRALTEYPAYLRAEALWVRDRLDRIADDEWTADDVARLTLAVSSIEVRDVAWSRISRDAARGHIELWATVARAVPRRLRVGPVALLAFALWMDGHDEQAALAVAAALDLDPQYRMAHLLRVALVAGMPADTWQAPADDELPLIGTRR